MVSPQRNASIPRPVCFEPILFHLCPPLSRGARPILPIAASATAGLQAVVAAKYLFYQMPHVEKADLSPGDVLSHDSRGEKGIVESGFRTECFAIGARLRNALTTPTAPSPGFRFPLDDDLHPSVLQSPCLGVV